MLSATVSVILKMQERLYPGWDGMAPSEHGRNISRDTNGEKMRKCDVEGLAHPDNILGLASGALLLAEDAGTRAHPVDMLWLAK